MKRSFPEKSEKEIKQIAGKFYRHLSDIFLENIAMGRMSRRRLLKMIHFKNAELFTELQNEGRNVVGIIGHYANWEVLTIVPLHIPHRILSVYKPMNNKFFDREFYNMRRRFGEIPVSMDETYKTLFEFYKKNELFIIGLIADQRPPKKSANYWTRFLNQDTPVFLGPEKIAKKFNAAVVYVHVDKLKRGVYEVELTLLFKDTLQCKENEITEAHVKLLESKIIKKPELWLWSHKRWKFKRDNR